MRPTFAVHNSVVITGTTSAKKNCILQITNMAGKWGKSALLTARLQETGAAGNTDLSNKELKFYKLANISDSLNQKYVVGSCMTDANGIASIAYTIPQDSVTNSMKVPQDSVAHTITASFAGDSDYNAQNGTGTLIIVRHITSLTVTPANAVFGQTVVFSATLKDNDNDGKGVSNQDLKFYKISPGTREGDTARVYIGSGTTNSSGVASFSYTLPQDSVINSISVSFIGDVNYSPMSGTGKITITATGVENNQVDIPTKFDLFQNYPNPFNPTSSIRYDIPKTGFVNISVYDILGRKIKVLVNEVKNPGYYEILFDARQLASGIYIYTIRTGDFTQSKKMIMMK